jgi:hypothetical protein
MKLTWTLAAALAVSAAGPALAQQQVEIEAPAPETRPGPEVVPPPLHYETTRPTDADYYSTPAPRVQHDPAFIEPFAAKTQTTTSTGRMGLSGWTAPNTPVGPPVGGTRDVTGWFALGFSYEWGGPPPAKRPVR